MHTETTAQQRNFFVRKPKNQAKFSLWAFQWLGIVKLKKKKSRNFTFYVGRKPNPVDVAQL